MEQTSRRDVEPELKKLAAWREQSQRKDVRYT
jgi:hypothetical protein